MVQDSLAIEARSCFKNILGRPPFVHTTGHTGKDALKRNISLSTRYSLQFKFKLLYLINLVLHTECVYHDTEVFLSFYNTKLR